MAERQYYSVREGEQTDELIIDFTELKRLVLSLYRRLEDDGYFAEAFGQECVDDGLTVGTMGTDLEMFFARKLRKRGLWPVSDKIDQYSEGDLFSVVELLHDYVSKPKYQRYHAWDNCGNHYADFDRDEGVEELAREVNSLLRDYGNAYKLSKDGEIVQVLDDGLEELVEDPLPELDPDNVESKVAHAISKFREYEATAGDKKDAVRVLADVLEFLRKELKRIVLPKDESDLFSIANNFAIRHHNRNQKSEYDVELSLKWIFHTYLATIHVVVGILAREKS